jgi:hypothetical protein
MTNSNAFELGISVMIELLITLFVLTQLTYTRNSVA